jgi:hypothetical protein
MFSLVLLYPTTTNSTQNGNGNHNSAGNGNGNHNSAGNDNQAASGNTFKFPSILEERKASYDDPLSEIVNTIGSVTNPTAGSGNKFLGNLDGNGNKNGNGNSAGVRSYTSSSNLFSRLIQYIERQRQRQLRW